MCGGDHGIALSRGKQRQHLRYQRLFGPIDVFSHDWTVMLMKYGKLSQDERIGAFLRNSGLMAMSASIASGAWILWLMARAGQGQPG